MPLLNEWDLANKPFRCSWDNKTYKYVLVEPAKPTQEIAALDKYVFIVRGRAGK